MLLKLSWLTVEVFTDVLGEIPCQLTERFLAGHNLHNVCFATESASVVEAIWDLMKQDSI